MPIRRGLWVVALCLSLSWTANTWAGLIVNGDFEAGGGSLSSWTVADQAGGSGSWFVQSGTGSPLNGFLVPTPPGPTNAAMTDQTGPGSHVLYQDFVVPLGVTAATLNYQLFLSNQSELFSTPDHLDALLGEANQQARIDIMLASADPFSVAGGDVLMNLYQTAVGDPAVSGYDLHTHDLTALLSAHGGETLRLRFAEVDNQFFFNMGVDQVSLDVTSSVTEDTPEPTTLSLAAVAVCTLLGCGRWRRRP